MKKIHTDLENKKFEEPEGIKKVTICRATGRKATDKCTDTYTEIFASTNIPAECEGHNTVKICKESGKVATEWCTDTEERAVGFVIDTEKNANWSPNQKSDNEKATSETCDIHKEAPKTDVPNVVGKSQSDATTTLQKAGFKVKVENGQDNTKAKGVVLKQSTTKAAKNAEITLTVNQIEGTNQPKTNTTNGNTTTNTSNSSTNTNSTNTAANSGNTTKKK